MLSDAFELYILPFMFVITGINAQNIFKMPIHNRIWLDDALGYNPEFVPVFVFSVRKFDHYILRYFDNNNSVIMMLVLGGWQNTRSEMYVRTQVTHATARKHGGCLDQHHFRKFKLEFMKKVLQIYTHTGIQWKSMMKIANVEGFHPVRGQIESMYSNAELIIKKQDINTQQTVWKVDKTLQSIRILESIAWRKDAENLGKCAILCYKDQQCKSFNYNRETNACQGHLENYVTLEGRPAKAEAYADHYYRYEN